MRFPMQWLGEIADGHIERLTIGESGAAVFRIRRAYGGDLFIKSEPVDELPSCPARSIGCAGWRAATSRRPRCWTLSSNTNVIGC